MCEHESFYIGNVQPKDASMLSKTLHKRNTIACEIVR